VIPDLPALGFLALAAVLAGLVDAVVGGGGLIQIPALFSALPGAAPATLFGTNKCASIVGTASATGRYLARVRLPWATVLPAALAALAFAYAGAMAVAWLPKAALRPLMVVLLILVAAHTLLHRDFGQVHAPTRGGGRQLPHALAVGAATGFYDGFFGPGTGSFLIFLFVRCFGFDFLHASAAAKVVNVATNLAALAYFLPHAHWLPGAALVMALGNVTGSVVGTRLALRHGSGFVRKVFLAVVSALIGKFAWDTFL